MFYGVEMDIIQMSMVIVLVADDVVPESTLPDHDITPDVFGLFIPMPAVPWTNPPRGVFPDGRKPRS